MFVLVVYIQDGSTALHLAAQEGRVDVVRLLIDTKAQINIQRTVCIMINKLKMVVYSWGK